MADAVKNRSNRSQWAMAEMLKKCAKEGFYGNITVYYENGLVTHTETVQREKLPVDMLKSES